MKVIVALDRSPYAERVIEAVSLRRWIRDTKFYVVTVVENTTGWFSQVEYPGSARQELVKREADSYIRDLAMRLKKRLPMHEVNSEVLEGSASEQIVGLARQLDADLIVVGQQGAISAGGMSLGSSAEAIVQKAQCSVEVVKPKLTINRMPGEGVGTLGHYVAWPPG